LNHGTFLDLWRRCTWIGQRRWISRNFLPRLLT
jgi:hypothetical protein